MFGSEERSDFAAEEASFRRMEFRERIGRGLKIALMMIVCAALVAAFVIYEVRP